MNTMPITATGAGVPGGPASIVTTATATRNSPAAIITKPLTRRLRTSLMLLAAGTTVKGQTSNPYPTAASLVARMNGMEVFEW